MASAVIPNDSETIWWKMTRSLSSFAVLLALSFWSASLLADNKSSAAIVVEQDGTVHVPAMKVPLSRYMSEAAKKRFMTSLAEHRNFPVLDSKDPDYSAKARKAYDDLLRPKVKRSMESYAVTIESVQIGGVAAHIVTPRGGVSEKNRSRVLINLHGGGFMIGGGLQGLAESIPVSSVGHFKVVTIDYRMAPEHKFPAASEDVATVYKELLKQYQAKNIGIYGCSAGGTLTAMSVAWLQKEDLPVPGAIGMVGAAAYGSFLPLNNDGSWEGDSVYLAPVLIGQEQMVQEQRRSLPTDSYLGNADLSDPLVSPALSRTVLAKFPPTLLITGTRGYEFSAAIQTHRELTKAGVESSLHLWDGMGHCFFLEEDLPESRESFDVIVRFFDKQLATASN